MSKFDLNQLAGTLVDEAMLGFLVFDAPTGECQYMNKVGREMIEATTPDIEENLSIDKLYTETSRGGARCLNSDLLEHEGLYQDILVQKTSGQQFIANIGVKKIESRGNSLLLLMLQDITIQKKLQRDITAKQIEIKAAYEELLTQNRQLKELDVAKNRFIALTTHELRTPLSAMVASAEVLKNQFYDTEEEKEEFISIIYEQGLHLSELINDILDFAKIQAGKMDFYIQKENVCEVVREIVDGQETPAENQQIELKMEINEEDSNLCYYDELRLKQVITNIVSNAIKYNKPGGWVKIWTEESSDMAKVFIQDNGKGIAEDQLEQVFNEFETLGKVALHHQGTGLGMPISKRLIEGMGGSINLESELGKGTKFWIEIPKERVLEESAYRERPDTGGDLAA